MAVRVKFQGTEADPNAKDTSFVFYFAEDELIKDQPQPQQQQQYQEKPGGVAFDGMSCTAFKMEHLQAGGQKPRGIQLL